MSEAASALPSLAGFSVLVVDDNENMRRLLHALLRAMRVDTIHDASSGKEALALLRDITPDAIVTDLAMKPLNGIDFVRLLRSDAGSAAQRVPVVMLTGYSEEALVVKAREAGVDDFIAKPVSARMLGDRLSRLVGPGRRRTPR